MKVASKPLPTWLKWVCLVFGALLALASLCLMVWIIKALVPALHTFSGPKGHSLSHRQWESIFARFAGKLVGSFVGLWLGTWLVAKGWKKSPAAAEAAPLNVPAAPPAPLPALAPPKNRHWSTCNILYLAPDAKRLWQFDAKGKGFVLAREHRVPHADPLPAHWVAKSWTTLWQPKLNVAWLPADNVFLRVVELPAANAEETFSMVELQLEKLSPMPVTQIVWTMHVLGTHQSPAKADGTVESLQSVIVVFASRTAVEEFLGRLERDGFQSDRIEAPMLDQLEAVAPREDSVWLFPLTVGGQNAALVAWWFGGAWRSLSFAVLPPAGDRAAELKTQLSLLAMSGEVEGWLAGQPRWYLVADPVNAKEWEQLLHAAVDEPVAVVAPPAPAELAARSATRAAASMARVNLQPVEYSARYREQFFDRLWLHGLGFAGVLYAVGLVIYFCAVAWLGYQTRGVESQVAALGGSYTNAIQLKARLDVLEERSKLRYAALDLWQLVAQELPASVTLQRFSFSDGQKLTLSGTVAEDQVNTLFDFNTSLKKKTFNNQPIFDPQQGDTVNPRFPPNGGLGTWNLSLELLHPDEDEPK
jgi:hypothetical protein